MHDKHRLHPIAALLGFLKSLKDLIIPIIVFFFIGNNDSDSFVQLLKYIGIGVIFLWVVMKSFLSWYRFTYYIEHGELRIEYGVFVRNKRYIPKERVQTIDVTAGLIQRMFGLVKLQIETAGGTADAEAVLNAITTSEAGRIRTLLTDASEKEFTQVEEALVLEENYNEKYTISPKNLLILASTSGGIGVILSAIGAFLSQIDNIIPYEKLFHNLEDMFHFSVMFFVVIGMIGIFLAWLLSIMGTLLKYGNFTLERKSDELIISTGILEKRQITLPITKIQAVRIKQNPLRKILGFAAVYVESAGASSGKEADQSTILFPIIKDNQINQHLLKFVSEYELPSDYTSLPKRALVRLVLRVILPVVPVIAALTFFLRPWGVISLIFFPLACLLGYYQFKGAGFIVKGTQLSMKSRIFSTTVVLIHKRKIQAFESSQSFLQKRSRLQTIMVSIKSKVFGRNFKTVDLDEMYGAKIGEWYSYSKKPDK